MSQGLPTYAYALVALTLTSAFGGCSQQEEEQAQSTQSLSVSVLDCGNVSINELSVLTPGHGEGESMKLTDTCFLVEHPQGKLLWDTGINDGLGAQPVDVFGGVFTLSVTHPLLEQLAESNIEPEHINYLALSHFHDDHTGNMNEFAHSELLIQRAEADVAFSDQAESHGFAPDTYDAFSRQEATLLAGRHDVFGDGSVVIYPAPGHSPGHQVLFLQLEETGPVVLSGDLYHFSGAREKRTVPSFNSDPEATLESMATIEALLAETGATLWIQHDFEQMSGLKRAPYRYR